MNAQITIKGNEVDGYWVRLRIPCDWLKEWGSGLRMWVFGRTLGAGWGAVVEGTQEKEREEHYRELDEAQEQVFQVRGELTDAARIWRERKEIDETTVIKLSD